MPAHPIENKWVDLLIKSYVKVGRVADAVLLTDEQLARIDAEQEPFVYARVALTGSPPFQRMCFTRPERDGLNSGGGVTLGGKGGGRGRCAYSVLYLRFGAAEIRIYIYRPHTAI